MIRFRDELRKHLKNKEFRQAFEEEKVFASLAIQIARLREKQGLSQKDLARRLHTSQQMISRIEHPENGSLSVATLIKLAQAFRKKLDIRFF